MNWKKKENLFGIGLGIVLTVIIFTIVGILINEGSQSQKQQEQLTTTPIVTPTVTPTPPIDRPGETVLIDIAANKKLLEKLNNRTPLSPEDRVSKARILALLPQGKKSGTIHQSSNILIEYIAPVDEFQVQLLTDDIALAKSDANIWFRVRGMSQKGICDLPLNFYLSTRVAESLRDNKIVFNVLANGCYE